MFEIMGATVLAFKAKAVIEENIYNILACKLVLQRRNLP